jgi:hypothetical protein
MGVGGVEASGLGQAGGGYGLVWLYFSCSTLRIKIINLELVLKNKTFILNVNNTHCSP